MKNLSKGLGFDIVSKEVKGLMVLFLAIGMVGFIAFWCKEKTGEAVQLLVLTLTLDALIAYAYYYYLLAKDTYIPVATVEVKEIEANPRSYSYEIFLHNRCSQAIQAQLNLEFFVNGKLVSPLWPLTSDPIIKEVKEFNQQKFHVFNIAKYISENSSDVIPGDAIQGARRVQELPHPGQVMGWTKSRARTEPKVAKELFRFKITVQIRGLRSGATGKPISEEHYYNFDEGKMVPPGRG